MRKISRVGALAFSGVLAVLSSAAGLYHRIYHDDHPSDPPNVSTYLETDAVRSGIADYLRPERVAPQAAAMSGSNTVPLSGAAHGSSSAVGNLTIRRG